MGRKLGRKILSSYEVVRGDHDCDAKRLVSSARVTYLRSFRAQSHPRGQSSNGTENLGFHSYIIKNIGGECVRLGCHKCTGQNQNRNRNQNQNQKTRDELEVT